MTEATRTAKSQPDAELLCARVDRDLVTIAGPDATSFLQSLVSQDLDPIALGQGAHALLLQPQGKLLVDFRALLVATDTWWADCDAGFGATLAAGLNRFRIRVKADVEDRSAATALLAVRGTGASAAVAVALDVVVPEQQHAHIAWRDARIVRADWPQAEGVDIVGSVADVDAAEGALAAGGVNVSDASRWEHARILAGVARLGVDIDERTIPQEAFLERTAVSFTKGCFVGQELVCRVDTRGHVNRFLRLVRLDATALPGAEVIAGEKVVGTLTSVAGDVALAMIRREIEPATAVRIGRDADATGQPVSGLVEALPGTD